MDLTAEQTATHSSSHGKDVVSAGARRVFRPDPQTTFRTSHKYYAAASDQRDQIEQRERSESEEPRPIGSKARVQSDRDRPGGATKQ